MGARDPAAPTALREYGQAAEVLGFDAQYVADIRALASEFEAYRAKHGEGTPTAPPAAEDKAVESPEVAAKLA